MLMEELEVEGRPRRRIAWAAGALFVVLVGTTAFPMTSWADARRRADPFLSLERENRAARRYEARERADAIDEATERARERERTQLKVDDEIDEHDDLEIDE